MSTDKSQPHVEVVAAALALCDRLCLNNDLYKQYMADASDVVRKFVADPLIRTAVQSEVTKRLNASRLKVHWDNSIACACVDIAYQIPDPPV